MFFRLARTVSSSTGFVRSLGLNSKIKWLFGLKKNGLKVFQKQIVIYSIILTGDERAPQEVVKYL